MRQKGRHHPSKTFKLCTSLELILEINQNSAESKDPQFLRAGGGYRRDALNTRL